VLHDIGSDKVIALAHAMGITGELPTELSLALGSGEVTPMGTATGFVPKEGMQETEEEKIKTRPRGCGYRMPSGAIM